MPNVSELARLEEEYEHAVDMTYKFGLGKSEREGYLREVRRLGKILGIDAKNYNGHSK